jgi:hypothetical protein
MLPVASKSMRPRQRLQILGNAADLDDGPLGVADGASGQHLAKLMRRAGILARTDIKPSLRAHLGQRGEVLRRPPRHRGCGDGAPVRRQ